MQNLKNKKNKLIKNRLTSIMDNVVMDRAKGGLGSWENGVNG